MKNSRNVITFDCYGTLIDWENGIRSSFLNSLARHSAGEMEASRVFELYEEEERAIEKGSYRPYRQVLSDSVLAVAKRVGWNLPSMQSSFLANDLPSWEPFADTNPALHRLAKRVKLGILSNVDNDLLAGTLRHLEVPFQIIVTAEMVRSYKPERHHFDKAREIMGREANWVHVAGSFYHDIAPATKLGIRTIWVNRKSAPIPSKLSPPPEQVRDLAELVTLLEA